MPEQENMSSEERIQAIRQETEQIYHRIAKLKEESDRRNTEFEKRNQQLSQEIREILKERERIGQEMDERMNALHERTDEHGRLIGGHGNKFGSYTESLAQPSIRRILSERFDARYEGSFHYRTEHDGETQIDGWGVARNGTGAVYLIEIKSRFKPRHIRQVWRHVELFRRLNPEHQDSAVYPILAVVEIRDSHRDMIWQSGIHLIDVSDGVFEWSRPPEGFRACGDHGADGRVERAVPSHLRLVAKGE